MQSRYLNVDASDLQGPGLMKWSALEAGDSCKRRKILKISRRCLKVIMHKQEAVML